MEMLAFTSFRRSSSGVLANGDGSRGRRGRWDGCCRRSWMTGIQLRFCGAEFCTTDLLSSQELDDGDPIAIAADYC